MFRPAASSHQGNTSATGAASRPEPSGNNTPVEYQRVTPQLGLAFRDYLQAATTKQADNPWILSCSPVITRKTSSTTKKEYVSADLNCFWLQKKGTSNVEMDLNEDKDTSYSPHFRYEHNGQEVQVRIQVDAAARIDFAAGYQVKQVSKQGPVVKRPFGYLPSEVAATINTTPSRDQKKACTMIEVVLKGTGTSLSETQPVAQSPVARKREAARTPSPSSPVVLASEPKRRRESATQMSPIAPQNRGTSIAIDFMDRYASVLGDKDWKSFSQVFLFPGPSKQHVARLQFGLFNVRLSDDCLELNVHVDSIAWEDPNRKGITYSLPTRFQATSSSNTVTVIKFRFDSALLGRLRVEPTSRGNGQRGSLSPPADFKIGHFRQSRPMVVEMVHTDTTTARPPGGRIDEVTITLSFVKWLQSSQDVPSGVVSQTWPAASSPHTILALLPPCPHVPFVNAGYEADILVTQPELFNKEVCLKVQGYIPNQHKDIALMASQVVWTCMSVDVPQVANTPQQQILLQAPKVQSILVQGDTLKAVLIEWLLAKTVRKDLAKFLVTWAKEHHMKGQKSGGWYTIQLNGKLTISPLASYADPRTQMPRMKVIVSATSPEKIRKVYLPG